MEGLGLLWKFLITIAAFVVLVSVMLAIDDPLYSASLDLIKGFSADWDTSSFAKFMRKYTNIGAIILIAIASLYALLSGPKIKQMMYLNAVMLGWVLCSFFKNMHHELRPCWADKEIPVIGSENDYGNPSGHSAGCGCVIFAGLLIYLFDNEDFCLTETELEGVMKTRTGFFYSSGWKTGVSVVGLAAYALIVFSRVYVGAHAINQVTYGVLLALLCVGTIFYTFRKNLISFYKHLFMERNKVVFALYVVIFGTIVGFIIAAQIISYTILALSGVELDPATLEHIRKRVPEFDKDVPLNAGLMNSGLGCLIIGAHIGLLFSCRYIDIDPTRISIEVSLVRRLGRLLFVLIMIAPIPAVAFAYIPSYPPLGYMWIKTIIPSLLIGFAFFGIGDYLMLRVHSLPEMPVETEGNGKEIPLLSEVKVNANPSDK